MRVKLYFISFALTFSSMAGMSHAQEVTQPYKGLTLNAGLELAKGKDISDGVILITHGGLAHRGMETITNLQELLKERGYNSLAINLSLGLDNRHGMYDCKITHRHRNSDAVDEIDAWVNWLKAKGVRRVTLLGHSRGGAQTALYAVEHDSDTINAVVLMAPATRANTDADGYHERYNAPLAPVLQKAQRLVGNGRGGTVMRHVNMLNCADTSVTADSFVSYYASNARVDTPELMPKFRRPTLVLVASDDEVVVGLDKKIVSLVDGQRIQMKRVEAADHTFRDLTFNDTVDDIDAFLKGVGK
jgi:pimeloyl-ACP methyl ester carboxylesterase